MSQQDGRRLPPKGISIVPQRCLNPLRRAQLTEPSPPDQVTSIGTPAWTELGKLVKAILLWERADTTKVRPRTRLLEKSIFYFYFISLCFFWN